MINNEFAYQFRFTTGTSGYIASFEIPYDTILETMLKLDAKIKEATTKFPANSEINDWRPKDYIGGG
ncbi:hypothetical protein LXL04_032473 [Taraxacum kok-saghyz]